MITDNGRIRIKQHLAGISSTIAESVAFGVGRTPVSETDSSLEFEVIRTPIELVSYDFLNDRLVFKTSVPDALSGEIHEVGLYSTLYNEQTGQYGSKMLVTFDSISESWADAQFNIDDARIGGDALVQSPTGGGSVTSTLSELYFDLSGNTGADLFSLAVIINSNISEITLSLLTDDSNYYATTLPAPAPGYQIIKFPKSSLAATGNPRWSEINSLAVTSTATAGNDGSIIFDGLRIESTNSLNTNYVLVSREILDTPYIKNAGMVEEIEISLGVSVVDGV